MQKLAVNERAALRAAVALKGDIVSALPHELTVQVFSHLPLIDAWRLQSVRRQWHKSLSSEDFLRAALSRWDTHDPSDSGRSHEAINEDIVRSRTRHLQAMRLARPFTELTLDDTGTSSPGSDSQMSPCDVQLKGSRIAYISRKPSDGHAVIVRDLVTGVVKTLRGEARERILHLVLTTTLVAFMTSDGWLYANKLSDPAENISRVRAPSANVLASGGDLDTIVMAMAGTRYIKAHFTDILVYDAGTRRLQSFEVEDPFEGPQSVSSSFNSYGIVVNSTKQTADIFALFLEVDQRAQRQRYVSKVTHLRRSLAGKVVNDYVRHHPISLECSPALARFTMLPPQPTGYRGQFRIQIGEVPSRGLGLPIDYTYAMRFDTEHVILLQDERADLSIEYRSFDRKSSLLSGSTGKQLSRRKDTSEGTSMSAAWKDVYVQPVATDWIEYFTLMNDTFLVLLEVYSEEKQRSRIRIFCFDECVNMPGARSTGLWGDEDGGQPEDYLRGD